VAQIMTRDPVVLREDDSVRLGGLTLLHHGISAAPVVDYDDLLVGVFSQTDILAKFAAPRERRGPVARLDERHSRALTVGDACSRPAEVISPDATVDTAARELLDRDIGRLIVMDGDKIMGIVSRSDILKLFLPIEDEYEPLAGERFSQLLPD
jgi:CBS domain-containing protein